MKNILFLIAFLISIPTFATCPIETGAACSVAQIQDLNSHTGPSRQNPNELIDTPKLNANQSPDVIKRKNEYQNFGAQPKDYSYNADCQFGICKNSSGAPQLFQNRKN